MLTGTAINGNQESIELPLNGILNYVFYYQGTSFLPSGTYTVKYLNSAGTVIPGAGGGTVSYTTNSNYTTGVQVQPPNPGATGPLGIQATLQGDDKCPYFASVTLSGNGTSTIVKSNGNGFFSIYYTNGGQFVPPGTYTLSVKNQFSIGNSNYKCSAQTTVTYAPASVTNPADPNYFVKNAAVVANVPYLNEVCTNPPNIGCL